MSGYLGQFMAKNESVFNTGVTVDRAFEVTSAAIKATPMRVEVPTIRAGDRLMRHRLPYLNGASGSVELPVMTKGFGWWLKHMLGTSTTGTVSDMAYTHTGTIGTPTASFTAQTGVPLTSGSSVAAQTATGGKLTGWELSCAGGGELKFKADADFAGWERTTALATPTYPTGVPLTFIRGSVTVDATPVISDSFSIKWNSTLNTDRKGIGITKREQKVDGLAVGTLDLEIDFEDNTMIDKINAATQAGATSAVVITIEDTALIGTTSRASLVATLNVMWDGDIPSLDGVSQTKFPVKGTIVQNATPISIAYKSSDLVA